MNETHSPQRIVPRAVRYIKLGEGGSWLVQCLQRGLLLFADIVPHEMALNGEWQAARAVYAAAGKSDLGNAVRELRDFYEQGEDCLWITFGQGRLWWAFAGKEVTVANDGVRVRHTLAPWSCMDLAGAELQVQQLSTSLTQTASYQRTICGVAAEAYLLRRVNADPNPMAARIDALTGDLETAVGEMISGLHWRDFEVLVDLIFARGGWRRIAAVGGSGQADSDLIVEQPVTGERAFVQIKSRATVATFRNYVDRFAAYPAMDRFFFACHSPAGTLEVPQDPRLHLWLRPQLASQVVTAGLVDWLAARHR